MCAFGLVILPVAQPARLINFSAAASDLPATLGTTHRVGVEVGVVEVGVEAAGGVVPLWLHCGVVSTHTLVVPWLLPWAASPW